MNIEGLFQAIRHEQPKVRLNAAYIVGLVEETKVLKVLAAQYQQEPDGGVKQVMAWAGRRIQAAQERDYDSVEEIFQRFRIQRELEELAQHESMTEARFIETLQDGFEQEVRSRTAGITPMANVAAGYIMGGIAGGVLGARAGRGMPGDLLPVTPEEPGRIMPAKPANLPFQEKLRPLFDSDDPKAREEAVLAMATLNNPAVLPALGRALMGEKDPTVRATLERVGRSIYLNAMYWTMSQDGTLAGEVEQRLMLMKGDSSSKAVLPAEGESRALGEANREEIAQILKAAEEKKRKKRGR